MGPVCSIRLLLVGMENSGKTTLLYRLKFGQYLHTKPTIGFNSEKVSGFTKKTKGVTFYMWDVEGKDNARPLWKSYLRSANGIIYVVDSADRDRLEEARVELHRLVRGANNPARLPTLVLASKQDLPDALTAGQLVELLSLADISLCQQCQLMPVCGVTGEGLAEAVDCLVDMVYKKGKSKHSAVNR